MKRSMIFFYMLTTIFSLASYASCNQPNLEIFPPILSPSVVKAIGIISTNAKITYHFEYRALGSSSWIPGNKNTIVVAGTQQVFGTMNGFTSGYTYFVKLAAFDHCNNTYYYTKELSFQMPN